MWPGPASSSAGEYNDDDDEDDAMMIMMIMITQVGLRQPQPPRQAGDERGQGAQGKDENSSKATGEN